MQIKKNLNKDIFYLIIISFLSIIVVWLFNINRHISSKNKNFLNQEVLKQQAYSQVENSMLFKYKEILPWDKKIEITNIFPDYKAAIGSWSAHDVWPWIAWQQDDSSWKILISFDGYNCQDLDTIPEKYKDFFWEQIYTIPNTNKKNCYDWNKK